MADTREWVRKRLGETKLEPRREAEVVAEIAGHVEERIEVHLREGMPLANAQAAAFAEAGDWKKLKRAIQRAEAGEGFMYERFRKVWLPGFAALGACVVLARLAAFVNAEPLLVGRTNGLPFLFLWVPFLVALPAVGLLAAYWSWRNGGDRRAQLRAAMFPAGATTILFAVIIMRSMMLHQGVFFDRLALFLGVGISLVILPAAMLALGAFALAGWRRRNVVEAK